MLHAITGVMDRDKIGVRVYTKTGSLDHDLRDEAVLCEGNRVREGDVEGESRRGRRKRGKWEVGIV